MPPANGKGSRALTKAREELATYKSKLTRVRKDVKESKIPNALMGGGAVLGGAAVNGATRALLGRDDVMGVPIDVAGGLLIGGISIGWGSPMGVLFSTGMMAPYVADATKDALGSWGWAGAGADMMPAGMLEEDIVIDEQAVEVDESSPFAQQGGMFATNFG